MIATPKQARQRTAPLGAFRRLAAPPMKSAVSLLACAAFLALSACSDSPAEARAKNEEYLDRLAAMVCDYHAQEQKLPESFDDALSASGQTLPHRGDYAGHSYEFLHFQDSAFCFRAGDVAVSYVNGQKVTHPVFVDWVCSHSAPEEWEMMRHIYDR